MFCIIKWSLILFVKAETRWFGSMGWVSSYFQIYHILKILRCKRVKSTSYVVTYVSWLVGETYRIDLLQTKYLSWLLNTLPNFFHLDMTWLEYMYCWSIAFCKQRFTNNDGICKRNTSIVLFSHIRIFKISGSTDMFCRGCSSECNVKDVLMNQIWIDFGPKLLRNFSGIYFKFLRETVLVSRCSALNVDNLRATDRCQVTTNLYGTFLKSLLYTLSTSQIKGTCKKWWGCMQFADGSQVLLETDSWSVGSVYGSYVFQHQEKFL